VPKPVFAREPGAVGAIRAKPARLRVFQFFFWFSDSNRRDVPAAAAHRCPNPGCAGFKPV
jgi:hypothetical protein